MRQSMKRKGAPEGGLPHGLHAGASSWRSLETSPEETARTSTTFRTNAGAVMFWGGRHGRPGGADGYVRRGGESCLVVDIVNDPQVDTSGEATVSFDLSDEAVVEAWESRVRNREWAVAGLCPVCSSLSRVLHPKVRDGEHPWGLPGERLPARLRRMTGAEYLAYHNRMLVGFFRLLWAVLQMGMGVWVEHPGDATPRLATGSSVLPNRFFDRRAKHAASLFRMAEWLEVAEAFPGVYTLLLQCPLGSEFYKPTCIWSRGCIARRVSPLGALQCTCPPGSHRQARGRAKGGGAASRQSQEYPDGLSGPLGIGMAEECAEVRGRWAATATPRPAPPGEPSAALPPPPADDECRSASDSSSDAPDLAASDDECCSEAGEDYDDGDSQADSVGTAEDADVSTGDEITWGASLPPSTRAAVEQARHTPPKWASHQRLAPASTQEVAQTAYPEVIPDFTVPATPPRGPGEPRPSQRPMGPRPRPPGGRIHISQLFLPGIYELVQAWMTEALRAQDDLAVGRYRRVPDLVITQQQLQQWAQGVIWDCRDHTDCVPMQPSDEGTQFPGGHQLNRDLFRHYAHARGGDEDIAETMGRGGLESYSEASLDCLMSFHHAGIATDFAAAARVIQGEIDAGFVSPPALHPQTVPFRVCPRNLVVQMRPRVDPKDGTTTEYGKPRVTFDLSNGARTAEAPAQSSDGDVGATQRARARPEPSLPPSPNAGVPTSRKELQLPSGAGIGAVIGVVDGACRAADDRAAAYAIDISNAYPTLPEQRLDWWMQIFLWFGGLRISYRVTFGGASFPQGFSRVMQVPMWVSRFEIAQFEATCPRRAGVEEWRRQRQQLQQRGRLPQGAEQLQDWNFRTFLDDVTGAASGRRAKAIPAWLRHIHFDGTLTRAMGGVPFASDSHAAIHMYIIIATLVRFGFEVAVEKTMGGDVIISVGFKMDVGNLTVSCPELKRSAMLAAASSLRAMVVGGAPLPIDVMDRFVGRSGNLSMVYPSILLWIHAGYALVCLTPRSGRARVRSIRLRAEGARAAEFLALLDTVEQVVGENAGIPMVHASVFPGTDEPGSLLQVTDASGDDGCGGYAFHSSRPGVVFVVHAEWPPAVRSALLAAGRPRAERARETSRSDMLSVPAAELATSWLVPYVVARRTGLHISSVTAVGDCDPVARLIMAAATPSTR